MITIPDNSKFTDDDDGYAEMVWYAHQNIFQDNLGYDCFIVNESATIGLTVVGYKRGSNRGIYLFNRGSGEADLCLFRVVSDTSYTYKRVVTDNGTQSLDMSGVTYDSSVFSELLIYGVTTSNLAIVSGRAIFKNGGWVASSDQNGTISNLPFTIAIRRNYYFPVSTRTATNQGGYIRCVNTDSFYFYGTFEAGAEYAFCCTFPIA